MIYMGVVILFIALIIGVPVCFAFLASALYFVLVGEIMPGFMIPYGINKISTTVLFAIPLFVIAGGLMEKGNIADKMIGLVENFVGRIRGGLGVVATVSCAVFGSVTGSACATLTCIGSIMKPRFDKAKYPKGHYAALLATSAVLGMLIPPSSIMILYSWTGGQSVLASFLATVVPGVLLTIILSVLNCYMLRNNKEIILTSDDDISEEEIIRMHEEAKRKKFSFFRSKKFEAVPALFMPVIVLGGIYCGIMTPTEAAAVAVMYALPVGMFIYKGLTLKGLKETMVEAVSSTGAIMIMLFACSVLSRIYIMEDVPQLILSTLYAISENKYVILLMLNIFMIILGMLMDDCSACVLATPILIPIINEVGISPVHFAAILAVNLGLGNVTPPCAPLLYLSSSVCKTNVKDMMGPTVKFLLFAWLPVLVLTTYVPALSMWLPRLILGIK